ncbi:MAG: hypothetical protein ABIH23_33375, partial [bacterium]
EGPFRVNGQRRFDRIKPDVSDLPPEHEDTINKYLHRIAKIDWKIHIFPVQFNPRFCGQVAKWRLGQNTPGPSGVCDQMAWILVDFDFDLG